VTACDPIAASSVSIPLYFSETEMIRTGPSKPEASSFDVALYGFTSAKVILVALGC
jgi:hypothetical protein